MKDPFRRMNAHKLKNMDPELASGLFIDGKLKAFMVFSSLHRSSTKITNIAGIPVCKINGPYLRLDYFAMYEKSFKERCLAFNMIFKKRDPLVLEIPLDEKGFKLIPFLKKHNYIHVTSKVTAFADIIGVFVKKHSNAVFKLMDRDSYYPDRVQCFPIHKSVGMIADIKELIEKVSLLHEGANHWSKYNKGNSWSALSLRGYGDKEFIIKPSSMSRKWKKENGHLLDAECRDTPLMKRFPSVKRILKAIPGKKERVRLMFLTPGGGELERHTDKIDKEVLFVEGGIARLHIPLVTNKGVEFTCWGMDGTESRYHMKKGGLYYLEIHKPHRAVNEGKDTRIHLVIDVVIEKDFHRTLIENYGVKYEKKSS